ncbi:MAG: porphobilinogen deaminase [Candidatus Methanofastidiosum methylothiophilum]|uniref:Probable porphobilinogen deaminase n=1 Tax=Candidatus Methanofastidiosum methylothiophilum TaxID=1705564 RepID=A0A150IV67_9EURY|nr:MAG: porphobilinogen deaminase [Candidatus Methanofastidiosum methylthiophilus]KYC48544.1 MAG: porphobilinogen deaminase [Candidatus Methanofastidiosum methylthiophilus]KYC51286.1 MAG: porphobilinogen deaminase [Candidatus Methanofastidiosum methylthiophilus]
MKLICGTRGSKLALTQTDEAIVELSSITGIEVEKKIIKTKGDQILDLPLHKIGSKGLFIKEIDDALINNQIDFAIHSLKDYPTDILPELEICAITKRRPPYDAIISIEESIEELPEQASVGTSSLRRKSEISRIRPDLDLKDIRGNLDTRIRKLKEGQYDAIIVAESGFRRLYGEINQIEGYNFSRISPEIIIPAPGQGALAIVCRKEDSKIKKILKNIDDGKTRIETMCERQFMIDVGGGCNLPVGALSFINRDEIELKAFVGNFEGTKSVRGEIKGNKEDYIKLAKDLAKRVNIRE